MLVLTRAPVAGRIDKVLAAGITRTVRGIPTEVALERSDGMPQPCVVTLDNVTTRPQSSLMERITRLGPERMGEVCRALAVATGC